MTNKIPRKYQPKGFEIIYDDRDVIVGIKAAGILTVSALWEKENTVHSLLNNYVRKGQAKSRKCVYVVHRIDQHTTGLLVFAKSPEVQVRLKDNWKDTVKIYYAVVHGKMAKKSGTIESYLSEDEDYVIHSSEDASQGKFAQTQYEVVAETSRFSLIKVNLLTGRKNQIRVHMADAGHPIVGDTKYGKSNFRNLALHAYSIDFAHPASRKRMVFTAPLPPYFPQLVPYAGYGSAIQIKI